MPSLCFSSTHLQTPVFGCVSHRNILSAGRKGECEQSFSLPSCLYLFPVVVLPITIQPIKKEKNQLGLIGWMGLKNVFLTLRKVNVSSGITIP